MSHQYYYCNLLMYKFGDTNFHKLHLHIESISFCYLENFLFVFYASNRISLDFGLGFWLLLKFNTFSPSLLIWKNCSLSVLAKHHLNFFTDTKIVKPFVCFMSSLKSSAIH